MTMKNDAKNKNVKTNVNNSEVHNRSSGHTNDATVAEANPSGSGNIAEEYREVRRSRRTRNAHISDIATSYIDDVGDANKEKGGTEVINNELQASKTTLREDTLKRRTQECSTVHVNDMVIGTKILDDNTDVQLIEELSTCQTRKGKGDQHSIIPPQIEDSTIPKGEKTYPMKDQNRENEYDNPIVQGKMEVIPLKRSRRKPIRNNKYDIFIQEENTRSLRAYGNKEGLNRKRKKVGIQKDFVDNTYQPNCEVKNSSIPTKEEDKVASNANVSYSRKANILRGSNDQLVNIEPFPSLTKNEQVPQKSEHYYCNVLGNDVLADAGENAGHNLCIPAGSNSATKDNANGFSAPNSAVNDIDTRRYDLSVVNKNMWNDADEKGGVKAKGEENTVEMVADVRTHHLDRSVRGFQRGKSHRFRGKGKSGLGRGRGKGKFRSKKIEYIKQEPYSINYNDLVVTEANNIFPHLTDVGGMAALPISEDAHESVVSPCIEKKRRGRKKKIQNSNAQESILDVNLNENERENKKSVKHLVHDRRKRRKNGVLLGMNSAPDDASKINLHIPTRTSSMLQGKGLPNLGTTQDDINNSGVYTTLTPTKRKVKDEKDKELLCGENSTLGVDTFARTNSGNVVKASRGSHRLDETDPLDYTYGRSARKRKYTERGKHSTGRQKSRGRGCTSVNISTNADTHRSDTENVLRERECTNVDNGKNSTNQCDNDGRRLFPNETFQIKEEFMNNVNSLNTVFNFNDEFLKFLKKISRVDDIDYDVMLPFLGEIQGKLAKDIKQQFPPECLDSHNVDESVYAMGYLVDILNNNNEILNKLNQLEYKFYYDYVRKKSSNERNKQKNYYRKTENEIALNTADISRDINNECCGEIQCNHLADDNKVKNESSKNLNEIYDEEERKTNELMYSEDKQMDDNYSVPTGVVDMYFMNYKEKDDFHHINERSLNLKNDGGTITLPNSSVVGEKLLHESGGTVGERSFLSNPTSGAAPQVKQCTGKERQYMGEGEKQGSDEANGQSHEKDKFAENETGEGPTHGVTKRMDKTNQTAENEKISKKISRKIGRKISGKINDMQSENNVSKNDVHFKYAHKLIKRNNFDFVCDELNELIKHTLKNEDLFYSNYSKGRYKNVNEESLFKHYISTKLYNTSNLVDGYKEEKEANVPNHKLFGGRQLRASEGISIKVDEREKTLMQSYADYFRRLNDVSNRGRIGENGKNEKEGNTEKKCDNPEGGSPCCDAKKEDYIVGYPKWENNYNPNDENNGYWKGSNPRRKSIVSSTIGKISHNVSALSCENTTPVKEKHSNETDDNTNCVSTNLQVSLKMEPTERLEKYERRNGDAERKQQKNGLNNEEQIRDGTKDTNRESGSIEEEEAQEKDECEENKFWFTKIIPFFKKNVNANAPDGHKNPDDVDGDDNADNVCDFAKQRGDRAVKEETKVELESPPSSSVGATEKSLSDGKSKIDGENANASIKTHDKETNVCTSFEGNSNSLDISKRGEEDKKGKNATDVSLCHHEKGIIEYGSLHKTCAHSFRHMNETQEKNIDTLLKETFHLKDNEFMNMKRDRTQKEILNCLRMVSQIKKIFFDECSKMINDQIYVLEKNFRIPDYSLSILKNSFDYNDDN
ncbi:conserved Plasmodium protein, unknown function [Plasmodium knowlesi strain H]|uniref:Uncharacterized protein n=3 Tax=Plasmodium knowlesi TaxID=5850 RepID=A0A5K1TZS9_PLAKH|nr:conserved Plasmodium protein, unknown function [Plasmodium knowlesi strain H]OTN65668.1 Uncharacterized protein PKNOH_S110101800 [Plasmodium knowlesi]CAA9989637.1 conserved Plasmodium protein, unknown function [Plasmodium knowlesi strain H]SBO22736.1 conserved Plasmodium protein, unknown function [Plasmodium knowlesi strain H]SBO23175.1 conserved Plasmodium protein, unknown function [Plasmodium knowlesi strain H]VVS79111.1 conserved Plasmodium protein, unknown function [Plasmodium knowlesi |eukprot:XP_002260361.1 hypothetical protein, conserved in Plasmodium species [Plasmodium knowlesi strain H]